MSNIADEQRLFFLLDLDESDVDVSKWEADFLESIIKRMPNTFTGKQRDVIDKMQEKYGGRI